MIQAIDNVVNAISGVLYQPYIVPLLLILAGIYFTIQTRLLQFRLFGESLRVVKEKPVNLGATSSFGALMVSTASRVGTGNIMGVSTALCLGGPGAIFWMWITAILGGASAFVESTLAQIYKKRDRDGGSYGGPSYYMQDALGQHWLGVVFAVVLILTYVVGYNMLAAYNTQDTFSVFSFYSSRTRYVIGAVLAVVNGSSLRYCLPDRRDHEHLQSSPRIRHDLPLRLRFQSHLRRLHRLLHHVGYQARPLLQ